jgi:hypothetical protein
VRATEFKWKFKKGGVRVSEPIVGVELAGGAGYLKAFHFLGFPSNLHLAMPGYLSTDVSCVPNMVVACDLSLSPILPTTIRETRYQSSLQYVGPIPCVFNSLTGLFFLQSEAVFLQHSTRSWIQFSVSRFDNKLFAGTETHSTPRPSYHSQGWTVSVHSEGKCYAYNQTEVGFSLVTEAHVSDPAVAERLDEWVSLIRTLASEKDIHLPETTDLFLDVDDNAGTCSYWFADHAHRKVFWLHQADTATVGLPNACSEAHLREYFYRLPRKKVLRFLSRIRPGGELLGSCGDVPGNSIPVFPDRPERTSGCSFECSCR